MFEIITTGYSDFCMDHYPVEGKDDIFERAYSRVHSMHITGVKYVVKRVSSVYMHVEGLEPYRTEDVVDCHEEYTDKDEATNAYKVQMVKAFSHVCNYVPVSTKRVV